MAFAMGCVLLRSAEAMARISFSSDMPGRVWQDCTSNVALGQRACLVEYHRIDSGYGIQVVPSFEQYAQAGCSADATEISQRNTYHQSART